MQNQRTLCCLFQVAFNENAIICESLLWVRLIRICSICAGGKKTFRVYTFSKKTHSDRYGSYKESNAKFLSTKCSLKPHTISQKLSTQIFQKFCFHGSLKNMYFTSFWQFEYHLPSFYMNILRASLFRRSAKIAMRRTSSISFYFS